MLKLQYVGYLMGRAYSLEKTLMLVKCEGKQEMVEDREVWCAPQTLLNFLSFAQGKTRT